MTYTDITTLITSRITDIGAGLLLVITAGLVLWVSLLVLRKGIRWAQKFSR